MLAARMAKTGRWMQTPSMLMVAPSGSAKLESSSRTWRLSRAMRMETGSVAALERVRKAVMMASLMVLRTWSGFSRQSTRRRSG